MTLAPRGFSPVKPCVHRYKPEQESHEVNSSKKRVDSHPQYQGCDGELDRRRACKELTFHVGGQAQISRLLPRF